MPRQFSTTRRIEFCHTDAAGIAHFSSLLVFMEQAEHEFLRNLGLSVVMHDEHGVISWPRVSAECNFQGAVRFEEVLDIGVAISRIGQKSVTYGFQMTCNERPVATGKLTSVCCRIAEGAAPASMPIPPSIEEKLRPFVLSEVAPDGAKPLQ